MYEIVTAPFRAVVWKELRQNLIWAAMGCALVCVGMLFRIEGLLKASDAVDAGILIISIFSATIFAPLIGFGLGLAQVILENRGDRWSFLVHRPLSRSTLFWGKVAAGSLLYTVAVGTPMLLAAIWLARPEHVPIPFDWRMTLPGVADLLCGLVYYFSGVLCGMRYGRLSRALGLGAGIVCTALVVSVPTFWLAAVCCVIGIVVVGTAALGSFISGGQYESQGWASRAATAFSLGSGLLVIGIVAVIVVSEIKTKPPIIRRQTNYGLTSDGTIVQNSSTSWLDLLDMLDLQGRVIVKDMGLSDRRAMSAGVTWASTFLNQGRLDRDLSSNSNYRTVRGIFLQLPPPNRDLRWYYVYSRGLLVEYDVFSSRIDGWLGPDGFTPGAEPPIRGFKGPLQSYDINNRMLLAFPDAVYRLDLEHRLSEKIFSPPTGEWIIGAGGFFDSYKMVHGFGDFANRFNVIATTRRIYMQTLEGATLGSVPGDPLAAGYGELQVSRIPGPTGESTFTWFVPENENTPLLESRNMPIRVTKYDSNGSVAAHFTLPRSTLDEQVRNAGIVASSLVTPVTARAVMEFKQWLTGNKIFLSSIAPDTMIPGWLVSIAVSVLAAAFSFMRGKSYAFPAGRLSLWTTIVFLLGPLGYVLMRVLIPWPAKETCSSCNRERIVTRERCEHCDTSFAFPAEDGTEIFESLTS